MNKNMACMLGVTAFALAVVANGCVGNEKTKSASQPLPKKVSELAQKMSEAESQAPPSSSSVSPARTLTTTGEFRSPVRAELTPRIAGVRVRRVLVEEGDGVKKGQALLDVEDDYLKLEVQKAEANLAQAQAGLTLAEDEFHRKEQLFSEASIPRAAYDLSRGRYEQAKAFAEAARVAQAMADTRLKDGVLLSPFRGKVAERRVDAGDWLKDGTVAFVLVQVSPLKLRFQLPERELARVHPGQGVRAEVAPFPGEVFEGRIRMIGQVVDPASRTFSVEAEFLNKDDRLKPGLFATVTVLPSGVPGA